MADTKRVTRSQQGPTLITWSVRIGPLTVGAVLAVWLVAAQAQGKRITKEFFFALDLADCRSDSLVHHFDLLRDVVRQTHPFEIEATVVLPERLHAIWKLPFGDAGFSTRWMLIKSAFSRRLPAVEHHPSSRIAKGERGIWQCRFWEHLIRDERAFLAAFPVHPLQLGEALACRPCSKLAPFADSSLTLSVGSHRRLVG